ncbi:hypothetical protein CLV56_0137 [Mumia flava]|uniref:Phosphodiesterase n=1 Tax=Mumia flava TaxID=1348852 RepID=A0A0B2B928_9ACTN|nr:DUF5998 family protein [Mumia flava]PJJ55934.1 hypothetical protein CLV56_0137 [Mumia flava]
MANRHPSTARLESGDTVPDRTAELAADVETTGFYPQVVAAGIADALASEPVTAYVLHHEPTFDRDEVRRHMTVLLLTPSRLLLTHTDEHPADDVLPEPYTSTTTEAVALRSVESVVVTRTVPTSAALDARADVDPAEVVLTIGWGAVHRLDLEPAACSDPSCEADHGYTGTSSADDFSLRVSAAAEGGAAVSRLLGFARALSAVTSRPLR